jgi:MFS family permease
VLLVGIDNTIVNVALPTIGRDLSAGISDLQWVVDGYTLVFATLLLVAGHLGDRFGRRRMLQAGLVLFALTSVAASFATSTSGLIAGRAAMGVGAALIYPATLALLMSIFTDRRQRATAIGIWSGISGLSVALGPVGGGLLVEHFGWNAVFLVNVPTAALALLAGRFLLTESRDPQPGRFDPVGAVGSMAGVGLLVWTIIEAPGNGWGSAVTLGGLAGSVALLTAFVLWEIHRKETPTYYWYRGLSVVGDCHARSTSVAGL